MWAEACEMLARAERLHRQFFEPRRAAGTNPPAWQPPLDVLETEREVLILVALPGVDPGQVEAVIEDGRLRVAGQRVLPPELRDAAIHRLELPQGASSVACSCHPAATAPYAMLRRMAACSSGSTRRHERPGEPYAAPRFFSSAVRPGLRIRHSGPGRGRPKPSSGRIGHPAGAGGEHAISWGRSRGR
jgi:HSP20 family protein